MKPRPSRAQDLALAFASRTIVNMDTNRCASLGADDHRTLSMTSIANLGCAFVETALGFVVG